LEGIDDAGVLEFETSERIDPGARIAPWKNVTLTWSVDRLRARFSDFGRKKLVTNRSFSVGEISAWRDVGQISREN